PEPGPGPEVAEVVAAVQRHAPAHESGPASALRSVVVALRLGVAGAVSPARCAMSPATASVHRAVRDGTRDGRRAVPARILPVDRHDRCVVPQSPALPAGGPHRQRTAGRGGTAAPAFAVRDGP